ncbi:MAG: manganese ABC transporter ATP-binding protein, partial [Anaerolineales bacterium]
LHDLKIARERFDRVMFLNQRLLGLGTPQEVFQPDILLRTYGGHMHLIDSDQGIIAYDDACCDEGGDS